MQTPIEWLEEQVKANLKDPLSPKFQELFDRAKEIEVGHLEQAYMDGYFVFDDDAENRHEEVAKQYINDKYKTQ